MRLYCWIFISLWNWASCTGKSHPDLVDRYYRPGTNKHQTTAVLIICPISKTVTFIRSIFRVCTSWQKNRNSKPMIIFRWTLVENFRIFNGMISATCFSGLGPGIDKRFFASYFLFSLIFRKIRIVSGNGQSCEHWVLSIFDIFHHFDNSETLFRVLTFEHGDEPATQE